MSESPTQAAAEPSASAPQPSARQGRGAAFWLVAPAVLALGVGGAGFAGWLARGYGPTAERVQSLSAEAEAKAAEAQSATRALRSELDSLRGALEALRGELAALRERQSETTAAQTELRQGLERLALQPSQARAEWALAEIEYLLLAASERLQVDQNIEAARAALELADQRLRDLDDPRFTPVRERLRADINALAAVEVPDVTGLALQLGDLLKRLDELPLRAEAAAPAEAAEAPEPGPDATQPAAPLPAWRQALEDIWRELRSYVVVRRKEPSDALAFDPGSRALLLDGLRAELMSARLAVLRRDTTNLHASAATVLDALERYFDPADGGVAALRTVLQATAALDLDTPVPDISGLVVLLRERAEFAPAEPPPGSLPALPALPGMTEPAAPGLPDAPAEPEPAAAAEAVAPEPAPSAP